MRIKPTVQVLEEADNQRYIDLVSSLVGNWCPVERTDSRGIYIKTDVPGELVRLSPFEVQFEIRRTEVQNAFVSEEGEMFYVVIGLEWFLLESARVKIIG